MTAISNLDDNTILLLEDIDSLFNEQTNISFSGILNILDGIGRKHKLMIFLTTNHKNKLDPDEIKLVDLSLVDGGYIISWNWNLGDGSSYDNQEVMHSYNSAGTYTISLNVTSNFGCMASRTYPNMINIYNNPIADFMPSTFSASEANNTIEFYNASSGGVSYEWDFDNGTITNEENPEIAFEGVGIAF